MRHHDDLVPRDHKVFYPSFNDLQEKNAFRHKRWALFTGDAEGFGFLGQMRAGTAVLSPYNNPDDSLWTAAFEKHPLQTSH